MQSNTPASPSSPVPAGLGTKIGFSVTGAGLTAAIVAFILGDRSEQTLGVLVGAGIATVFGAVTIGGRMLQAALRDAGRTDLADAIGELKLEIATTRKLADMAGTRVDSAHQRVNQIVNNLEVRDRDVDGQAEDGEDDGDDQPRSSWGVADRREGDRRHPAGVLVSSGTIAAADVEHESGLTFEGALADELEADDVDRRVDPELPPDKWPVSPTVEADPSNHAAGNPDEGDEVPA